MADAVTSATSAVGKGSSPDAELLRLVYTDDLTQLYNRRFFSKYLKQDIDWSDGAPPIALCICDLDYLKKINDRLGHIAGDKTLKRVGQIFIEQAGEGNLPVRYAGDEFALILPGRSREDGLEAAERIRKAIQDDPFEDANLPDGLHPSLSVGVAWFPEDAKTGDDLVDRADKALYFSKRTGKNRVTSAHAVEGQSEVADIDALSGFPSKTVVGREDAFHALGDAVDLVSDGRNAFVLIEGPAGVGKTRFLSELVRYSRERDLICLLEKCSPVGREQAYRTIAGLLDRYFRAEPNALATVRAALDEEKRAALGDIVPAVREHETAAQAASAAAALKQSVLPGRPAGPAGAPATGAPANGHAPGAPAGAPPKRPLPPPAPGGVRPRPPGPPGAAPVAQPPAGARPGPRPPTVVRPQPPAGPGPAADTPTRAAARTGAAPGPTPRPPAPRPPSGIVPVVGAPQAANPPGSGSGTRDPITASGVRPAGLKRSESGARPAVGDAGAPRPSPPSGRIDPHAARTATPAPLAGDASREAQTARAARSVNVFVSVCEALAALSRIKPVLIIFDDVEHADEATLEVVARALPRDGRILFCGAARQSAAKATSPEEDTPYVAFHESLAEFPNVFKIELGPLDRERTGELATHLLQGWKPPVSLVDRLFEVSKGNPLFVEGALRYLVTTGVVVKADDGWKIEKEAPEEIPVTLEDLVRGQLAVLDKETAELLADAAVIGPNFDFEVLRGVGGKQRSEGEALDLVEAARRARIIKDTGGGDGKGDFEFASSVVADVTYKNLSEEKKRTAHLRVAELKEKRGEADASELAFHYRRAGEKEKADRFEVALRERSEQIFDREAIEQLDDDVKAPRIPEVRDPPTAALWPLIPALAKALVPAARAAKAEVLPGAKAPAPANGAEARDALLKTLARCFDVATSFTLSHRGNSILLNGDHGHAIHGEGPAAEALAGLLRVNRVKSITFLKSPSLDEISEELGAVLGELGSRTIETPMERQFWWRFCMEKDLRRVCVVQKVPVLKKRRFTGKRPQQAVRLAESHLPKVREFVWNFATAFDAVKLAPQLTPQAADALSALDRTLRSILALVPALAINEHDGGLVVNGTLLSAKVVGQGAPELVKLLVQLKLRGFVMLSDISHQELTRFVERIARLGPKDLEADKDPGQEISADGSFPNVLVGEAMFKMAQAALGPIKKEGEALEGDGESDEKKDKDKGSSAADKTKDDVEDAPIPGLPANFTWPSDAVAKRARELVALEPAVAVSQAKKGELLDVTELLLLDGRESLARRLWEHYAIAFTHTDPAVRKSATEIFIEITKRGTAELRTRFYRVGVRRVADALEIESNVDLFELLAKAVRAVILERIGDGDFDVAARLTWSLARKREGAVVGSHELLKITQEMLKEILRDPRAERLFETIETGSVQDRRRAARVLEAMGTIAVPALVDALKRTGRGRVETFLIDLLAGLVPDSEQAILREVTPYAPAEAVKRLLRAASVVCRDPTHVLITALQNPDPQVRVEAVSVARSLGGSVAQAVLKWAVKHGAVEAQLAAVTGLGELARGDAADSILELLDNAGTVEVQRECALALGKLQAERAVPVLARLLRPGSLLRKEEHEDVRHAAAWSLGQMRQNEEARKALERALEDKNKNVRLAAKAFLEGRA